MGAKSVIRDVARVMGVSYGDADRIAKMIEAKPGVTLKGEWESKPELRELIEASSTYQELWNYALKLEGHQPQRRHPRRRRRHRRPPARRTRAAHPRQRGRSRHPVRHGRHHRGRPAQDGLPRPEKPHRHPRGGGATSAGTSRISTSKTSRSTTTPTFEILNRGETMGVFQLESGGMVETCRKYQIEKIDDIIDLLALYRPGAMQFIDQMIEVKKGRKKAMYEHPLLEQVCGNTYGVMIYQEQVQNAAKLLAGYTLGGADLLRRAMGKKDPKKMAKERGKFVEGCGRPTASARSSPTRSSTRSRCSRVTVSTSPTPPVTATSPTGPPGSRRTTRSSSWPRCFPTKSTTPTRSASSFPSATAWASRSCRRTSTPRSSASPRKSPSTARRASATAWPPSRTAARAPWPPPSASARPTGKFTSLDDFSTRLDSKVVNKRILENLVKAGALDWTGETRAGMFNRLEQVVASASSAQRDKASGQVSLFDAMDFAAPPRREIRRTSRPRRGMEQGRPPRPREGIVRLLCHRPPARQVPRRDRLGKYNGSA
jgi:DNA polymerase III subunit alpha